METTGKQISIDKVLAAVRAYGLQKTLASDLGMPDAELSKFLDAQLPKFIRLLLILDLTIADKAEVDELRSVLKRYL